MHPCMRVIASGRLLPGGAGRCAAWVVAGRSCGACAGAGAGARLVLRAAFDLLDLDLVLTLEEVVLHRGEDEDGEEEDKAQVRLGRVRRHAEAHEVPREHVRVVEQVVVVLAHLRAGEDLVGIGVLLEEGLGARVRVLVRVPLARQLAVRALDRQAARVLPNGGGLVRGGARRRASREGG